MDNLAHTIRPAAFEDASAIFELIGRHQEELLPRPISDIIQNIDRIHVCVAENKIIGTISWSILPEIGEPNNASIEIKSLAVDADYRNSGIGKELVNTAIEHIKLIHPVQVVVLTFTPEFFTKLGFTEVPKETLMHKLYMGCINCTKHDSPFTCPETSMSMVLRK